jgi:hypothetical protein
MKAIAVIPGKKNIIGTQDMTTDDTYLERGINLLHGFLTEYYVDDADHIVKVPKGAAEVGVLLEPLTVVEKGIAQAYEIQRRLRVWKPRVRGLERYGELFAKLASPDGAIKIFCEVAAL